MPQEDKELTPRLVMKRFFHALTTENLMAAELLAVHEQFNGGDVDYTRKLNTLVCEDMLSTATIEWLLSFAKGSNLGFFKPGGEYSSYRRRSGNNWRGHLCDKVRRWMQHPDKLTYDMRWLSPDVSMLDSESGQAWLKEITPPDRLLELALFERSHMEGGQRVTHPPCLPVIDWLIAKGPLDLSKCGDEIVREYTSKKEGGRALALRLLRHRDPEQKMPKEVTDMIQEVLQKYKLYQKLQQDLPTLLGAKTHEIDP
jgi:hypothetical protein